MQRPDATIDDSLNRYVLDHYRHLITAAENQIVTALGLNLKALNTSSVVASKKLARARGLMAKLHVQAALKAGYHESRTKIRCRLLSDHSGEVRLNRCPQCDALCRTPTSQMCVACGHSWHDQDDANSPKTL